MSPADFVNCLLLPSPPATYGLHDWPSEELVFIPRSLSAEDARPEDCVPALFLRCYTARFVILYLHSNAEDLGRIYSLASILRTQFQVHVLAVEYPGYGLCPGHATEESVIANARLAMQFVLQVLKIPEEDIIVMGRSIGCGSALALAAQHPELYGVVLICPFLSVRELCREYIGRAADMLQERFPNSEWIQKVRSPTLIVHGQDDTIVPWSHGRGLYDLCGARKRLVAPADMKHNSNLHSNAHYFVLPMLNFFGLPDYNYKDLKVPAWIFDKRMSTFYVEEDEAADEHAESPFRGCVRCVGRTVHGQPLRVEVQPSATGAGATRGVAGAAHTLPDQRRFGPQPTKVRVGQAFATPADRLTGDGGSDGGESESDDGVGTGSCESAVGGGRPEQMEAWPAEHHKVDDGDYMAMLDEMSVREASKLAGDELPEPPDDVGYFKVPRSRGVSQQLLSASPSPRRSGVAGLLAAAARAVRPAGFAGGDCGECCLRPPGVAGGGSSTEFASARDDLAAATGGPQMTPAIPPMRPTFSDDESSCEDVDVAIRRSLGELAAKRGALIVRM